MLRYQAVQEKIIVNDDNLFMAISGLTETEKTLFSIKDTRTVNNNLSFFHRYVHMIHMDYSVETVERSVYNLLMLLGDVGGLYGLLFSVFATLNNVLNFQKSENTLV